MRADVKLGIVISLVLVTVAGGYYLYRDTNDAPIQLVAGPDTFADQLRVGGKIPMALDASSPQQSAGAKAKTNREAAPKKRTSSKKLGTRADRSATKTKSTTLPVTKKPAAKQPRTATKKTPARDTARQGGSPLHAARSTNNKSTPKVAVETHRVQRGDTMASIAEGYYGDPALASFLADANPHVGAATTLTPGQVIKIPAHPTGAVALTTKRGSPLAATRQIKRTTPDPKVGSPAAKAKTYRVQSGDSFYKIAKTQLGDASRWKEIFELNKKVVHADPKRLQTGQILVLPAG